MNDGTSMSSHDRPPRREQARIEPQRHKEHKARFKHHCSFTIFVTFVLFVVQLVCSVGRAEQTWLKSLPANVQRAILWSADYETGNLRQWVRPQARFPGGGIFNTGGADSIARAQDRVVHSGRWALEATIQNAYRGTHGDRAVRMMVWTDRAWDDGGRYFPVSAYYGTWLYVPHAYDPAKQPPRDPGDGGWWNVFQFKSEDANGDSQPLWVLNLSRTAGGELSPYLYSPVNEPRSYVASAPKSFPAAKWVHIEVFYAARQGKRGEITLFLNGERVIQVKSVLTSLGGKMGQDIHPIWGIGNYTDHITGDPAGPGRATIFFDDAAVSTIPLGPYVRGR
jgi:hypothetical protein